VRADYDGVREPLATANTTRHAGVAGLGATFKLMPNTVSPSTLVTGAPTTSWRTSACAEVA